METLIDIWQIQISGVITGFNLNKYLIASPTPRDAAKRASEMEWELYYKDDPVAGKCGADDFYASEITYVGQLDANLYV